MKIKKSTIVALVIIITGGLLLLYPTISNWWNTMHQTRAIGSYIEQVEDHSEKEKMQYLKDAEEHNENLLGRSFDRLLLSEDELTTYNNLLKIPETETMAIVEIPKINKKIPIYHGTDEAILQIAVGHIPGTSLPVGGKGTHSVITGHTGLPSARLFTDIEKLGVGDVFMITTFGKKMTYEVDQLVTILPNELDEIRIDPEKDYVTLQTCTPYGINTHRLLVRGTRIDNLVTDSQIIPDAIKINPLIVNTIVILGLIGLLLILKFIISIFRK